MKKILAISLLCLSLVGLTGCNKDLFDTVYRYDKAIMELQNGEVIEGKVEQWKDYEGEQLQIKMNGKIYLVHSKNVTLIAE